MTGPLIASISSNLRCNTTDGTEIFEVKLDRVPYAVTCSATELYVGGGSPHQICIFDFTGHWLQTIPVESIPYSLAVHKSGLKFACGFRNGMIASYGKHDDIWTMTTHWQASERTIHGIVWINDDEICSGCDSGSITTWNPESGERIKVIQSKGPWLYRLSPISNDGRIIFSGYGEGAARRHNLEDGSMVEVKAHSYTMQCICATDEAVLTGSRDKTVAAFDIETLTEKWRYQCVDWATSMVVVNEEVFVGVRRSFIIVLNVNTGEFVRQFDRKTSGYVQLALQPIDSPFARFKFED